MNKKKAPAPKKDSAAIRYLVNRYAGNDPKRHAAIAREELNLDIAQQLYDLRTAARLTQRELARRVGTTAPVISRLEDAGYAGHSLSMLRRIAEALGFRIQVRFLPARRAPQEA
jgi:ribosome-binding protein aMBF1 (putative translation factor)